jgi:hypothetical protein
MLEEQAKKILYYAHPDEIVIHKNWKYCLYLCILERSFCFYLLNKNYIWYIYIC